MGRVTNLLRRIHRDGPLNTARGVWSAVRVAHWGIYRLGTLAEAPPAQGFEVSSGPEELRAAIAGVTLLPDQFYYGGRPGYENCSFATVAGSLAGVQWVIRGASRYLELAPTEAELGGLYVLPAYRGRGIGRALVWRACVDLLMCGATAIYTVIEDDNTTSRRVLVSMGFERMGNLHRSVLFGRRLKT